jgi:uncharacterized protein
MTPSRIYYVITKDIMEACIFAKSTSIDVMEKKTFQRTYQIIIVVNGVRPAKN